MVVGGGGGGVPSDYFVSTQLQLWLFCCRGCACCWAVTIRSSISAKVIGVFKARQQGGPKRIFLLICFDDHSNPVPTNGKSVPTKLLLNLAGGAVAPPGPLGKYAYGA